MIAKLVRFFILSAGAVLFATATAKLVAAGGSAPILQSADPVLGLSFEKVFLLVGVAEIGVAAWCWVGKRTGLQASLIAWLATNFVGYRLALIAVGSQQPCRCLGSLTDALHISADSADVGMKFVLGYLLIGSYATLIWLWKKNRRAPIPADSEVITPVRT